MSRPLISNTLARRLFLDRHLLMGARSGTGKGQDLSDLISTLGFVQLDSVNTFSRAHDLILWSRRQQYRPRALELALARDRTVFEHWTHDASTIPIQFFPYWRMRFRRDAEELQRKWNKHRRPGFLEKTEAVLKQISDEGCCSSLEVGLDEEKSSGGWWDWNPSKTALEYLWHSGALSVTRRDGFRKVYDLTERVIPAEYLNAHVPDDVCIDWHCWEAMRRLGFATSGEVSAFWATVTKPEAKDWCAQALSEGRLIEVDVESADGSTRCHYALPEILDLEVPEPSQSVRILSPFDPALRDRKRAERLFGFHYRIEIFVPAAKRQYGYYVFPVMEGDRMIGRIDMKRTGACLDVTNFWPETRVKMGSGRLARLRSELERAARFAGCDDLREIDACLTP